MRVCVIGTGLAGSLLAWRLGGGNLDEIHLVSGDPSTPDATGVSGGVVRGYEPDPDQRELAIASMAELLSSEVLRAWSGYRRTGCVYLPAVPAHALGAAVAQVNAALDGSARITPASEVPGFAGLPCSAVAVVERDAGHLSPRALRAAVLADLPARVHRHRGPVGALTRHDDGTVGCALPGGGLRVDAVVVAAGSWTARILAGAGLPAAGYRTKAIRYAVHPTAGPCPPPFVDEHTGLYGRPTAEHEMLLGVATDEWDPAPGAPPPQASTYRRALDLARQRLPGLRPAPATRRVAATDCYHPSGVLALRQVATPGHLIYTFSGGSGGAVKTSLAASRRAATALADARAHRNPLALTVPGERTSSHDREHPSPR